MSDEKPFRSVLPGELRPILVRWPSDDATGEMEAVLEGRRGVLYYLTSGSVRSGELFYGWPLFVDIEGLPWRGEVTSVRVWPTGHHGSPRGFRLDRPRGDDTASQVAGTFYGGPGDDSNQITEGTSYGGPGDDAFGMNEWAGYGEAPATTRSRPTTGIASRGPVLASSADRVMTPSMETWGTSRETPAVIPWR